MELLAALGSIILVDVILSGDNAVVIALASRNLPLEQRKKVVMWGSLGAVALRVVMTFIAAMLLKIPLVQFVGGGLLLVIAVKLLGEKKDTVKCQQANSFLGALKTIIFADFIMSLDNVLAIAGVARGHMGLLAFGLMISIPLVVFGSQILMKLMDKFPVIVYLGAAVLGWTAATMMVSDAMLGHYLHAVELPLKIVLVIGVIVVGHLLKMRTVDKAHAVTH